MRWSMTFASATPSLKPDEAYRIIAAYGTAALGVAGNGADA